MGNTDDHSSGDISVAFVSVLSGSGANLSWYVLVSGSLFLIMSKVGGGRLSEGQKREFMKDFFQDVVR